MNSQKGVIRVNCVDCLDRTNNAMACISSVVFGDMLKSLGADFKAYYDPETLSVTNELLQLVLNMFGGNGDKIAQQYAGSDAFHKAQIYKSEEGTWRTLKQSIALIAVKRYISNTLMDSEKQRCFWLFLGEFTPEMNPKIDLWDIDPASREADEQVYKNSIDCYVNTLQEKLTLSDGRLKRLTLLDINSYHNSMKLDYGNYFDKEIKYDLPIALTNQDSGTDPLEKLPKLEVIEKSDIPKTDKNPTIFTSLGAMNDFSALESKMWSDFSHLSTK